MSTKKGIIVYFICLYLVGSAVYTLFTLPWSARFDLLAMAVTFQSLKLAAGISLFIRHISAPYLASAVLLWVIVATVMGFQASPLNQQSIATILYVAINTLFLVVVVLYSFALKQKGYFVGGGNA